MKNMLIVSNENLFWNIDIFPTDNIEHSEEGFMLSSCHYERLRFTAGSGSCNVEESGG